MKVGETVEVYCRGRLMTCSEVVSFINAGELPTDDQLETHYGSVAGHRRTARVNRVLFDNGYAVPVTKNYKFKVIS